MLSVDEELIFQKGKINLIIGATGAGKTSLLMALLGEPFFLWRCGRVLTWKRGRQGEMHFNPAGPDSFMNLPREGGVAYAAQESWVLNDTIRVCRRSKTFFSRGVPFDDIAEQYYLRSTVR